MQRVAPHAGPTRSPQDGGLRGAGPASPDTEIVSPGWPTATPHCHAFAAASPPPPWRHPTRPHRVPCAPHGFSSLPHRAPVAAWPWAGQTSRRPASEYFYADQKGTQPGGTRSSRPLVDLELAPHERQWARLRLFYAANNTPMTQASVCVNMERLPRAKTAMRTWRLHPFPGAQRAAEPPALTSAVSVPPFAAFHYGSHAALWRGQLSDHDVCLLVVMTTVM